MAYFSVCLKRTSFSQRADLWIVATAVLNPSHTQIWLLFRICFSMPLAIYPIGFNSLYVSLKNKNKMYRNTLIYQVVPYLWRKVFIKIRCNTDLVHFTATLKLPLV